MHTRCNCTADIILKLSIVARVIVWLSRKSVKLCVRGITWFKLHTDGVSCVMRQILWHRDIGFVTD